MLPLLPTSLPSGELACGAQCFAEELEAKSSNTLQGVVSAALGRAASFAAPAAPPMPFDPVELKRQTFAMGAAEKVASIGVNLPQSEISASSLHWIPFCLNLPSIYPQFTLHSPCIYPLFTLLGAFRRCKRAQTEHCCHRRTHGDTAIRDRPQTGINLEILKS